MTLPEIANKHLDLWFADGPPQHVPSRPSLHDRVVDALTEAQHQSAQLWLDGNATLKHERDAARNHLECIRAACSFDPAVDRDLETCVRRIYHERADLAQCRDDAVEACRIAVGEKRP